MWLEAPDITAFNSAGVAALHGHAGAPSVWLSNELDVQLCPIQCLRTALVQALCRGALGSWRWKPLQVPAPAVPTVEAQLTLCEPPSPHISFTSPVSHDCSDMDTMHSRIHTCSDPLYSASLCTCFPLRAQPAYHLWLTCAQRVFLLSWHLSGPSLA